MPGIISHSHAEGTCPVTGATSHAYCAPQDGDSRAPCPALNTLANHGYIPRDGKKITPGILVRGLQEGYGLSLALATVLAYGGKFLLGQYGSFELSDLARHNRIEHDASLIHGDAGKRDEYAPLKRNTQLWEELEKDMTDGVKLTTMNVAEARVRREREEVRAGKQPLDGVHAEIARGEMAIALGMFSHEEDGIPAATLKCWMKDERLPDGWKPTHIQGLLNTVFRSLLLRIDMGRIEASQKDETISDEATEATGVVL